jgi:hypothetical protein
MGARGHSTPCAAKAYAKPVPKKTAPHPQMSHARRDRRLQLNETDGCADQFTLCISTIRAETTANSASAPIRSE